MRRFRRGQSLVEILFASAVMLMLMASSAAVMSVTEKQVEQMSRQQQAMSVAEEGIQAAISIADRSWADMAVGTHGLAIGTSPAMWIFQGTSDTNSGFTRTITVSDVDSDTRQVVVTVTWHPEAGRTATVQEEMTLTDWPFI